PPPSTLFPYTTLFRSNGHRRLPAFYGPNCGTPANQSVWIAFLAKRGVTSSTDGYCGVSLFDSGGLAPNGGNGCSPTELVFIGKRDRKSTRLNSSHDQI